jgi:hypothetical protein
MAGAQTQPSASAGYLDVSVMDEDGQALPAAFIVVEQNNKVVEQERTAPSGNAFLHRLAPGKYRVLIQKPGFYTATVDSVEIVAGQTLPMEVRLQPVREYREEIEVAAQPSPIDPEQVASSQPLTAAEIAMIPYPSTRDYRNVLPYVPGVITDSSGQAHIAGSSTQQIQDYLDGFEVSQPASGSLALRVNPDSLRRLDVQRSRYSALLGKGSGGAIDLAVLDGDNRFRFGATDFIPTFQNVKGFELNNWTPRAYVSGPVVRNKVWFTVSHEGELDNNVVKELPAGADTNNVWRIADLARLHMNLTPGNVLTASGLVNVVDSEHGGITIFDPYSVSNNTHGKLYMFTLKDQATVAKGTLFEFGAAYHRTDNTLFPQGTAPYVFTPTGRTGNYFQTIGNMSDRVQGFSNLFLKPWRRHQITLGGRLDRVVFQQSASRGPIEFVDSNNVLLRQIVFQNAPPFSLDTVEASAYAQDRWSVTERLLIEGGGRWDHDSYLKRSMFSPRLAGALLLHRETETKLSAGIGVYYDRTNLAQVSLASQGSLTDTFLAPAPCAASAPCVIQTSFLADPRLLTMPRFINSSVALETRLPARIYFRAEYLERHGIHGWAYESQPGGSFLLLPGRQDRYDAVQFTARKEIKRGYPFLVSYTRSNARSNQTIDFSLTSFITGRQAPGPLPWDSPNQITSWGSLPLFWKLKKFDLAYSTLWRTGFPFFTVNDLGVVVSGPGQFRFPDYFTLNVAVERKFTFHRYRWAARVGMDNVTDRENPTFVDNNVNSPTFLALFGQGHRTFNGHVRFLGKAAR